MTDCSGDERQPPQGLQRFIFAFETCVPNCEKDFRGGRLKPEPAIDLFWRKVAGLCGYGFVVVGLEVVADALQRDAGGKTRVVRRSRCLTRIARREGSSLVHV